jgi:hypothetical protein
MEDLLPSLLVVAITGAGVAGLFLYLAWRRKQQETRLEQAARERGWQLEHVREGLVSGLRLTGKNAGTTWTLEAFARAASPDGEPGSSSVSQTTRWWSEDARLAVRAVVVGPAGTLGASGAAGLTNPLLKTGLMQLGMRAMLGNDAAWVAGLSPAPVGSPALVQRYSVLAYDARDAKRLLDAPAEARLVSLPPGLKPVVILRETGLEINLSDRQVSDPRELEALIDLGVNLVRAWQATP